MADSDATRQPGRPAGPSGNPPTDWSWLRLPENYVIEAEIGRGGMGTVLRARDLTLGRSVAIKVLRPEVAQKFGTERFLREIHTAAQLVHPHIVAVFESGTASGALFYVMPHIEGESLRARLERSGALPLDEALRIVTEIASALQYAHERGIVHRDVKPENILLSSDGHAWLADFGVARASAPDANLRLTQTGLILGTPLYLSPEQARNDKQTDHRADIYSLGCVLYEVLAGEPVFGASSIQAVVARHLTDTPAPLHEQHSEVPPWFDEVIQKALAKAPEDRYASASAFATALTAPPELVVPPPDPNKNGRSTVLRRLAKLAIWVAGAAVPVAIGITVDALSESFDLPDIGSMIARRESLDTTRYIVMPFEVSKELSYLEAENKVGDALATWVGIDVDVVSQTQINGRGAAAEPQPLARLARRFRAGRVVTGSVARMKDSIRVYIDLADGAEPDVKLKKHRGTFPLDGTTDARFKVLADSVLLHGVAQECVEQNAGTRLLSVVRDCHRAFAALSDGDFPAADSNFQRALRSDAAYARGALWLAQVRSWIVQQPAETTALITVALADSIHLTARERTLARALSYLTGRQSAAACALYRSLTQIDSLDYAAWLGIGECHRRDDVVVRDASRGWRFRSSYHRAVEAYRRAFQIQPSLIAGRREHAFLDVRELFMTSNSVRYGRAAPPDTTTFIAHPAWEGDSLAFRPIRAQDFSLVMAGAVPATVAEAADRQNEILRQLASAWVSRSPENSAALEAYAVALELAGDAEAVDAMKKARALARNQAESVRLAAAYVWLIVKSALPMRPKELQAVRVLADSLVQNASLVSADQARDLATLALLLGRPNRAAELARRSVVAGSSTIPAGIIATTRALLAFAAAGAPIDSIQSLERTVETAIRNAVSPKYQRRARRDLLTQAAMIAFPVHSMRVLPEIAKTGVYTEAEFALQQGDTAGVRSALDRLKSGRANHRPADITIDALYVEAWLRAQLGEKQYAAELLDSTLIAMPWFPPGRLQDMVRAGTLMRALALRAEFAHDTGDGAVAERWARAVTILWADAEPALRPVVARMRALLSKPTAHQGVPYSTPPFSGGN